MKKLKKRVLLILGGNSKEREVSLDTGKACYLALKKLGFHVTKFDPQKKYFNLIDFTKVDLIFNALHGKEGEDGIAQSYFEYFRIPYTHSGVVSSMNAMDKIISKEIFKKNKIKTPQYFFMSNKDYSEKKLKIFIKKKNFVFPVVIKPVNEGSSIGVKICKNLRELLHNANKLIKRYERLIFEKYIGGQEIQVAVMNSQPLGAIELKPKRNFYDYKAKYTKSAKTEHIMPANITKKKYNEVLSIAKKTHKIMNCRGVTRSDFKFFKNMFYLLEINTQPGMTNLSLVPEIARYNKITFTQLVEKIILDADINK